MDAGPGAPVIQEIALAVILAGVGILGARVMQRRMDRVEPRQPAIQEFYDRMKSEQLVSSRDV